MQLVLSSAHFMGGNSAPEGHKLGSLDTDVAFHRVGAMGRKGRRASVLGICCGLACSGLAFVVALHALATQCCAAPLSAIAVNACFRQRDKGCARAVCVHSCSSSHSRVRPGSGCNNNTEQALQEAP